MSLRPAPAQTIIGFGASGAWWPDDVVGFSPASRALVARLLFDRSAGLGLSIYRYNIGGGVGVHAAAAPPASRTSTGSRRGQACRDPE